MSSPSTGSSTPLWSIDTVSQSNQYARAQRDREAFAKEVSSTDLSASAYQVNLATAVRSLDTILSAFDSIWGTNVRKEGAVMDPPAGLHTMLRFMASTEQRFGVRAFLEGKRQQLQDALQAAKSAGTATDADESQMQSIDSLINFLNSFMTPLQNLAIVGMARIRQA